jgi:hypothetical protein
MSTIADIAAAVVTELNGHAFGQPFTAQRLYLPVFDLADMTDLHVTVVPKGVSVEPFGRAACQYDYSLDVGVQKKLSSGDAAEIDPLLALVEEIGQFFRNRRLAAYPAAIWARTEYAHLYAQEHMAQLRQFTSVITLTFRVIA